MELVCRTRTSPLSAGEMSALHNMQFEMHSRCKQQVTYIYQLCLSAATW